MLLDGKVALVSGIGRGLSRSIAFALAEHGAQVALTGIDDAVGEEIAKEMAVAGYESRYLHADVTDVDQCASTALRVHEDFGHIDTLVNVAYLYRPRASTLTADLDDWRDMMEVIFYGSVNMSRAVAPYMKEQGEGRIVMINTTGTLLVREDSGGYATAKGALATLTRVLAQELGRFGIRVNAIHPSYIYSDNLKDDFARRAKERGVDPQVLHDEAAVETALGYLPEPDEIAGSVVFLASDLSRPVTGQHFAVCAGRTA